MRLAYFYQVQLGHPFWTHKVTGQSWDSYGCHNKHGAGEKLIKDGESPLGHGHAVRPGEQWPFHHFHATKRVWVTAVCD
jgi:hypothetical protein